MWRFVGCAAGIWPNTENLHLNPKPYLWPREPTFSTLRYTAFKCFECTAFWAVGRCTISDDDCANNSIEIDWSML